MVLCLNLGGMARRFEDFLCSLHVLPVSGSLLPVGVNVSVQGCLTRCQPCDELVTGPSPLAQCQLGKAPPFHDPAKDKQREMMDGCV